MVQYAMDGMSGETGQHFPPITANSIRLIISRTRSPGAYNLRFTPSGAALDLSKFTLVNCDYSVNLGYGPYDGVSVQGTSAVYFNGVRVLSLTGSHNVTGDDQRIISASIAHNWVALSMSSDLNEIRVIGSWSWNDTPDGILNWTFLFFRSQA